MSKIESDEKNIWHPFTPLTSVLGPQKTVFSRALGAYLYDEYGKKYFDATSSWWSQIHGHCHPRLVLEAQKQIATLDHMMFAPHTHEPAILLSEKLIQKTFLKRCFFSDNGSTAVETAMKMVLQYWLSHQEKRTHFLSLEKAYHGDTLGAVSVGGISDYHTDFDLFKLSFRAEAPYCYRCPLSLKFPSCKIACLDKTLEYLNKNHSKIAALIIEPLILGAAGMISYPKEYLEKLSQEVRRFEIPVIYDEVFTGFGRTGTMFAFEQIDFLPDILCLSKGLTSGMLPLSATLVNQKIEEAFKNNTFYHGHTYTANPVGCRIAYESMQIFEEDRVLERNQFLINIFSSYKEKFLALEKVGDVRHLGMVFAIEFKEISNIPLWKIAESLWNKGIWIRPLHNVIYIIPPYCTTEEELTFVLENLLREINNATYSY